MVEEFRSQENAWHLSRHVAELPDKNVLLMICKSQQLNHVYLYHPMGCSDTLVYAEKEYYDAGVDLSWRDFTFDKPISAYFAEQRINRYNGTAGALILYQNNGDGIFKNVSKEVGLDILAFAMAGNFASVADLIAQKLSVVTP